MVEFDYFTSAELVGILGLLVALLAAPEPELANGEDHAREREHREQGAAR